MHTVARLRDWHTVSVKAAMILVTDSDKVVIVLIKTVTMFEVVGDLKGGVR